MRISLATLAPDSRLAQRVRAALARDGRARSRPAAPRRETWRSEEALHRAIVAMLAAEARPGVIAFHPPNGGGRSKAEAGRFRAMGVVPGIPDLIVIVRGRAFGLEIKTEQGRLSAAQKAMQARFARAGCAYAVCRSVDEARTIMARWGALA